MGIKSPTFVRLAHTVFPDRLPNSFMVASSQRLALFICPTHVVFIYSLFIYYELGKCVIANWI